MTIQNKLREKLAARVHKMWSSWMEYLFSKGTFNDDGTWTMPKWAVERWQRQMNTSYNSLPDEEKVTDLLEADGILSTLGFNYEPGGKMLLAVGTMYPDSYTHDFEEIKQYRKRALFYRLAIMELMPRTSDAPLQTFWSYYEKEEGGELVMTLEVVVNE